MLISEVCGKCGVSKDTIRYYQRFGLLMDAARNPKNGYAVYLDEHVERLRYIKKLSSFGFSLREIKAAIALDASGSMSDSARILALEEKLEQVKAKMRDLSSYKKSISQALKNLRDRMTRP